MRASARDKTYLFLIVKEWSASQHNLDVHRRPIFIILVVPSFSTRKERPHGRRRDHTRECSCAHRSLLLLGKFCRYFFRHFFRLLFILLLLLYVCPICLLFAFYLFCLGGPLFFSTFSSLLILLFLFFFPVLYCARTFIFVSLQRQYCFLLVALGSILRLCHTVVVLLLLLHSDLLLFTLRGPLLI